MSQTPTPAALLLVGHGSHYSLDSSRPVHELARRARAARDFAEVRVAFWKEEPFLHHAFHLIESETVLVVPIFTSVGYFTDQVVPRELGIEGSLVEKDGRVVRYLPPIGSRPEMVDIVLDRGREALEGRGKLAPSEATLVVLGHGTDEHAESGGATLDLAARLARESEYASVVPAFLDQRPTLAEVLAEVRTRGAVVVPFFVSEGWHVGTTIPRDLARATEGGAAGDRWIAYAKPVGTHPDVYAVVADLARGAWKELGGRAPGRANEGREGRGGRAAPSVQQAKAWFIRWVESAHGPRSFLQTAVWADPGGRFEVRHERDVSAPAEKLRAFTDPRAALDIAKATEDGGPRPLRTSPDLKGGWRFVELDGRGLWEVYANLYPGAPVHVFLHGRGELPVVPFEVAAGRQTGIYAGVGRLQGPELASLVERRCGSGCLRVPVWDRSAPGTEPFTTRVRSGAYVACNQPCSLLISEARSTLDPSGTPG